MDSKSFHRTICMGAITTVFALVVFSLWAFVLPSHLRYNEQIQYFPYTWEHFRDLMSFPGGLSSYLAEFCIQFFRVTALGALILTLILALVQLQASRLIFRMRPRANRVFLVLSLIPAVCALAFLCQSGNMLSAVIALLISVQAWLCLSGLKICDKLKLSLCLLAIPLLYYLCGPFVYVYVLLMLLTLFTMDRKKCSWLVAALALVLLAATVLGSQFIFAQYPFKWLCLGVDFSHQPGSYPLSYIVLLASVPMLALVSAFLPAKPKTCRGSMILLAVLLALETFAGWKYVKSCISLDLESIYAYDCAALDGDWQKIIDMADEKTPMTVPEVTCLNLALVMTGQSAERLFDYFQAGVSGLFPNYEKSYMNMLPAGEALWRSGMLNIAMHYAFEAYQSFPDGRESARQLKRLAEVNLINGHEDIADKYLKNLSKTLFYGSWARKWLKHPALSEDSLYEELATKRDTSDLILNDSFDYSKQDVLRSIVTRTGEADCSYHYLLAYDLLDKDMEAFKADFELVPTNGVAPAVYQQALLMDWLTGRDKSIMESPYLSQEMKDFAMEFREAILSGKTQGYMKQRFGKTLWYYYASNSK